MCLCGHTYASVQSKHRLLHRPPWGPSREPRVRAAVKSQEQTCCCTAASQLQVRFRSALPVQARASVCPGVSAGPPAPTPAHRCYSPTCHQLRTSTRRRSPPQCQAGRAVLQVASAALSMSSLCVLSVSLWFLSQGALSSRDPVLIGERSPAVPSEWGVHMGLHPRAALTCSLPLTCCPASLCRHVNSMCPSVKWG